MIGENKINVLFVLIQAHQGGTERIVMDLIRSLNSSKFNCYMAYFEKGDLINEFKKICKEIYHIPKKRGLDISAMLKISQLIKENNIYVINSHHYMPFIYSYLGSRILNKRRLIYTEHSVPEVQGVASSKHKKIFGYMLGRTDSVVCISKEIGDTFKNSYPRYMHKFRVIVNGVDVDRFANHADRDKLREQWGITPSHFVVGTVANFRKVKNHACLIRAFDQMSSKNPHLRVMLVGQGFPGDRESSESELIDLIHAYGLQEKVIMTGYQENITDILKVFDVFCLPSLSEGLPVSVLEAMAARVPVIGSNVRGINEVIFHEITGLLFSSDDETALASAISRLLNDENLREKIIHDAYHYVHTKHGLKQWISKYETLFSEA